MEYTGIQKSRSMPLIPIIRRKIAYSRLKNGKPISRFTRQTRKEVQEKTYLIYEARRLMALATPCADNASLHNLTTDGIFEDVNYDSEEYTDNEDDTSSYDSPLEKSKMYDNNTENNGKSTPIHIHLLDNELETYKPTICNDISSVTSDTEYIENLNDNFMFQMDEELDIIDDIPYTNGVYI